MQPTEHNLTLTNEELGLLLVAVQDLADFYRNQAAECLNYTCMYGRHINWIQLREQAIQLQTKLLALTKPTYED